MSIDIEDIQKLAELARIEVSQEELEQVKNELGDILDYVSEISNVEGGDNLQPNNKNIIREDFASNSEDYTDMFLDNAPKTQNKYIEVDQVL